MKKSNAYPRVQWLRPLVLLLMMITAPPVWAQSQVPGTRDLPQIRQSGVLRHLGVPYANFVTGSGDGMDVELMQRFAAYLGVKYHHVQTTWENVIADLCGRKVIARGDEVVTIGSHPVRGDLIANGLTVLPWRQKVLDYSTPLFPTQIWLLANAGSALKPIVPSGDPLEDIRAVKKQLRGYRILGKANTCLDPALYGLAATGAVPDLYAGNLNELAPAVINGKADATLLDVPDALIALEKWHGRVKVIGPLSPRQYMGVGFSKGAPLLKQAFNAFFQRCQTDGTYLKLIKKYYPAVFNYYPDFFKVEQPGMTNRYGRGQSRNPGNQAQR